MSELVLEAELEGISSNIELSTDTGLELVLSSELEGISSYIELSTTTALEYVRVEFSLCSNSYEDVPIKYETVRSIWEQIRILYQLVGADTYNFENIPLFFQITIGSEILDIPIMFSIIRQMQNFSSYIMQKLYCVSTILSGTVTISDWNVRPNKTWYVGIVTGEVTLYNTLTDLNAGTNPVATGTADSEYKVFLMYIVDEYDPPVDVDLYYQDFDFHLTLSAVDANGKYKIKPLTDMSEIRHPIYNNSNLVLSRGEAELNLHTNVVVKRELLLGTHEPLLEPGEVVRLTSVRRNVDQENSQVLAHTISGTVSGDGEASLISTIQVANYTELYR